MEECEAIEVKSDIFFPYLTANGIVRGIFWGRMQEMS